MTSSSYLKKLHVDLEVERRANGKGERSSGENNIHSMTKGLEKIIKVYGCSPFLRAISDLRNQYNIWLLSVKTWLGSFISIYHLYLKLIAARWKSRKRSR